MSKNHEISISNLVSKIKETISLGEDAGSLSYLPDIIEFCNSKRYLNLLGSGIKLHPMQNIILKTFYRGQRGNEHLKLTHEETKILFEEKMQSVLDKYHSEHNFRELVLVLGRRSGKDFMTSLIALYESMKLLELPGGSPFKYYNIAPGNPIYIITVATSADQARILFNEIKAKMQTSEYFKNRIGKIEADRIWLLTPEDKKLNNELVAQGMDTAKTAGSVVIMSGHSNSDGLLGKRVFCLLLDEVASFKTTGGATSGDRIYAALGPATADFAYPAADGKRVLDSKIVSISSPRAEEGVLYKLWADTPAVPRRLAFKLPTWKVNRQFNEMDLRTEYKFMSPNQFAMEFGAEFSGTAGEKFIAEQYIAKCQKAGMELGLDQRIRGIPGMVYYAHLDPASTSHNYALVVLHVEERIRIKENEHGVPTREKFKLFVVDHIKFWQPAPDKAISVHEVDNYIIDLAKRFKFALVTYDEWNSLASIQKLRAKGIPTKATPFRKAYKMSIYDHLEHLMINGQLALPYKGNDAELLYAELKYLKRIYGPQGFKIKPDEEAPVNTDDFCDALAGACGIALETAYGGYAKSGTVYMPQNKTGESMQWNIGHASFAPQQWQFLNRKFGKL